jgi:hypothetical protein
MPTLIYEHPLYGRDYLIVADVSAGLGRDYHCAHVIDFTGKPYKQVAVIRDNLMKPQAYAEELAKLGEVYNEAFILVENNGVGGIVLHTLEQECEYQNLIFTTTADKRSGPARATIDIIVGGGQPGTQGGVRTTPDVKRVGSAILKYMLEHGELLVVDRNTYDELTHYARNPKTKTETFAALPGKKDDAVSALILLGWLVETEGFGLDYLKGMRNAETSVPVFCFHDDGRGQEHLPPGFENIDQDGFGVDPAVLDRLLKW